MVEEKVFVVCFDMTVLVCVVLKSVRILFTPSL